MIISQPNGSLCFTKAIMGNLCENTYIRMESIVHIIEKVHSTEGRTTLTAPNSHSKRCRVNVWLPSHWTIWRAPSCWVGKAQAMCCCLPPHPTPVHHGERGCLVGGHVEPARWLLFDLHMNPWTVLGILPDIFIFFPESVPAVLDFVALGKPFGRRCREPLLVDLWSCWGLQIRPVTACQISSPA